MERENNFIRNPEKAEEMACTEKENKDKLESNNGKGINNEEEIKKDVEKVGERWDNEKMPAHIVFRSNDGTWKNVSRKNFEYVIFHKINKGEIDAIDVTSLTEEEIKVLEEKGVEFSDPEKINVGGNDQKRTILRIKK